ncbi:hypothetical protein Mycch_5954 (plasmid) [Mycolicibacterium chubuense NBB4]|uniref:Uncharacterized protein n=1 Tax=Mycolicibacterium chubuense (strain NBB4) TaxID=710421 RepID=I4BTF1_MYCCN|nr:hypothetical protein Mycch_5954 [Mycolicibacterium chubuense NBB4]
MSGIRTEQLNYVAQAWITPPPPSTLRVQARFIRGP